MCTDQDRPRAPAVDASLFEQEVMIQKVIDDDPSPEISGTKCLNLNITVPDVGVEAKLPVLVWIHGGGFIMGGNYLPHWDPVRLVKMSEEYGTPVIVVSVKYGGPDESMWVWELMIGTVIDWGCWGI